MKAITLLLAIFLPSGISAQTYTPLVQEGATWINYFCVEYPDCEYRAYKIEGDTVVNALNYKKVYMYNLGDELVYPFQFTDRTYYGSLREDVNNKKVYGIVKIDNWGEIEIYECEGYDNTDQTKEFLLYDFDIGIGDASSNCQIHHEERNSVIEKDTIENIFGKERRVLYNGYGLKLIEGIGYEDGIFMQAHIWVHAGWGYGMQDFCNGLSNSDCELSTSLSDLSLEVLKVYPNPISDYVQIETKIPIKNVQLIPINGSGIKELVDSGDRYLLPNVMDNGLYLLRILSENGSLNFRKIVVSN